MLAIVGLVLGLSLGILSGGQVGHLRVARVRGETALLLALVFQATLPVLRTAEGWLREMGQAVWLVSILVVLGVAAANLRRPGMAAIALGALANGIAIASNGQMPVSRVAMRVAGFSGDFAAVFAQRLSTHTPLGEGVELAILCDVMPVPGPSFIQSVVSVGDVLLVGGIAALLVGLMCAGPAGERS